MLADSESPFHLRTGGDPQQFQNIHPIHEERRDKMLLLYPPAANADRVAPGKIPEGCCRN